MITVIDYGMGNLRSVARALELSGGSVKVSSSARDILQADSVVLPGVGAFSKGMMNLNAMGLTSALMEAINTGKPFLGICLGMQLMYEGSEEGPACPGLGVFKGKVKRFDSRVRVPHVGWNTVRTEGGNPLFKGIDQGDYFYFVHSYYAAPKADEFTTGRTVYGDEFASAIRRKNVYLTQFHPEKSQEKGMRLLRNFCKLKKEETNHADKKNHPLP